MNKVFYLVAVLVDFAVCWAVVAVGRGTSAEGVEEAWIGAAIGALAGIGSTIYSASQANKLQRQRNQYIDAMERYRVAKNQYLKRSETAEEAIARTQAQEENQQQRQEALMRDAINNTTDYTSQANQAAVQRTVGTERAILANKQQRMQQAEEGEQAAHEQAAAQRMQMAENQAQQQTAATGQLIKTIGSAVGSIYDSELADAGKEGGEGELQGDASENGTGAAAAGEEAKEAVKTQANDQQKYGVDYLNNDWTRANILKDYYHVA